MGLDMYLEAERYISGWTYSENSKDPEYDPLLELFGISATEESPNATVRFTVAYWRKANHIHRWFVENVQDGVDDCKDYYVSRKQLEVLRGTCRDVLADPATGLLPTQSGFFFGPTEYDDYYRRSTQHTIEQIDRALMLGDEWSCHYHSSW